MFKLGGKFAVNGSGCPFVAFINFYTGFALVYHGFYGKGHARPQLHPGVSFRFMVYLRVFVKFDPDTMAAILMNHTISVCMGIFCYIIPDIADIITGLALLNAYVH